MYTSKANAKLDSKNKEIKSKKIQYVHKIQ